MVLFKSFDPLKIEMEVILITLENITKAVRVLKASGKKTLRIMPGFNYVDIEKDELAAYSRTPVNKSMIEESIRLVGRDAKLSKEDDAAAKSSFEKNEKLNKAQKIIQKQNEQILKKDQANDDQANVIKELTDANSAMTTLMAKMQKQLDKLEKKEGK